MYILCLTQLGETLDRIFLSLKSQFANFEYEKKEFIKELKQFNIP